MSKKLFLFFIILTIGEIMHSEAQATGKRWAVYYTDTKPWEAFTKYDVIVFDSDKHPEVQPLRNLDKTVLAYLSLVEVSKIRAYFNDLEQNNLLLKDEISKQGRYFVDVRNPKWAKVIIEEVMPKLIRTGFNGIILDTIDDAVYLERNNPDKYDGMPEATVALVRIIRMHYPYMKIMMNRGFSLLPELEKDIDMVLAESILVDAGDTGGSKKFFPDETYQSMRNMLHDVKQRAPHLEVYTLDYWDMADKKGVQHIYNTHRQTGFNPYVSTIDLQDVFPEPL